MMWFFAVLIVLAIGGVALVAAGTGDPLARVYDDRPDAVVPADGPLTGEDLRAVRFSTAVRGYRASEVDALLTRLAAQLDGSTPTESGSGTLSP
jgi:DivIVA domain-containing protein